MNTVKYNASMDRLAIIVTVGSILLLVFIGQMIVRDHLKTQTISSSLILQIALILFLVAIPVTCWLFSTHYYSLNNEMLTIHRPARDRRIPISMVSGIQLVSKEEMKGTLRVFAVGGLFGYFGKFMIPKFGSVNAYATQMKNLVLVTTVKGEQILLSPDDTGLVRQVQSLKQA